MEMFICFGSDDIDEILLFPDGVFVDLLGASVESNSRMDWWWH
jgi:hypothetical protein